MTKNDRNYSAYLSMNLEKYKGKWGILRDKRVIASGENIKTIVSVAQAKYPDKNFLLARIPRKGMMIF